MDPEEIDLGSVTGVGNFLEDEEIVEVIDLDQLEPVADSSSGSESEGEEPIRDDAELTFKNHTKAVFSVNFHPEGKYCVSGGKDDIAYVWNMETGQELYKMDKFVDSVIIASFSFDGKYLATVDMSGTVQVRKCPNNNTYTWDMAFENDSDEINWGFWHSAAHIFIASTGDGTIYLWKIPSGESKILYSHGETALCGELFRDAKKMAVAYQDRCIKIWDLKTAAPLNHVQHTGEDDMLTTICIYMDIVIVGESSGEVYGFKSHDGKKIGMMKVNGTPTIIKACNDSNLGYVAIATFEGSITIWEVPRQCIRYKSSEEDVKTSFGVRTLLWIDHYLLIGCCNGSIRIINAKSAKLEKTLCGHKKEVFDMSYLASSKTLISCSEDKTCKLFKLDLPA